jgi:hypothetical protein
MSEVIEGKCQENPYGNWSDVDHGTYVGNTKVNYLFDKYDGKNIRIIIEELPE